MAKRSIRMKLLTFFCVAVGTCYGEISRLTQVRGLSGGDNESRITRSRRRGNNAERRRLGKGGAGKPGGGKGGGGKGGTGSSGTGAGWENDEYYGCLALSSEEQYNVSTSHHVPGCQYVVHENGATGTTKSSGGQNSGSGSGSSSENNANGQDASSEVEGNNASGGDSTGQQQNNYDSSSNGNSVSSSSTSGGNNYGENGSNGNGQSSNSETASENNGSSSGGNAEADNNDGGGTSGSDNGADSNSASNNGSNSETKKNGNDKSGTKSWLWFHYGDSSGQDDSQSNTANDSSGKNSGNNANAQENGSTQNSGNSGQSAQSSGHNGESTESSGSSGGSNRSSGSSGDTVVSSSQGSVDPYTAFAISDCDTYGNLWMWDTAMTCGDDGESCECIFAEQLMDRGLLSCDDAKDCPYGCSVCGECLHALGCAIPVGTIAASYGTTGLIAAALLVAAVAGLSYCHFCRNGSKDGEGDEFNPYQIEGDSELVDGKRVWVVPLDVTVDESPNAKPMLAWEEKDYYGQALDDPSSHKQGPHSSKFQGIMASMASKLTSLRTRHGQKHHPGASYSEGLLPYMGEPSLSSKRPLFPDILPGDQRRPMDLTGACSSVDRHEGDPGDDVQPVNQDKAENGVWLVPVVTSDSMSVKMGQHEAEGDHRHHKGSETANEQPSGIVETSGGGEECDFTATSSLTDSMDHMMDTALDYDYD